MEVKNLSLTALWELQNLYLEKVELEQSLNTPEGKKLYGEKHQILNHMAALKQQEEKITGEKSLLKKLEDKYAELTVKYKSAEEHLYSGDVKNPKELAGIEQQIELLKKELDSCEEELLLLTEKLEEDTKKLEQEKKVLDKRKQDYKAKVNKYLSGKKQLEERLKQIRQEIINTEKTVSPELLNLYNRKKQRLGFKVLSLVQKKTCSACHMVIPSLILKEVKQGNQLVTCENCGRILYWG